MTSVPDPLLLGFPGPDPLKFFTDPDPAYTVLSTYLGVPYSGNGIIPRSSLSGAGQLG
jgi:hypothetical protein